MIPPLSAGALDLLLAHQALLPSYLYTVVAEDRSSPDLATVDALYRELEEHGFVIPSSVNMVLPDGQPRPRYILTPAGGRDAKDPEGERLM